MFVSRRDAPAHKAAWLFMNLGQWRWLKEGRFGVLTRACARLLRRGVALLEISTPEAEQLLRRVTTMERDLMLPVKAAGIGMLLYAFSHGWIKQALETLPIDAEEWAQYSLRYYIPANVPAPVDLAEWTRYFFRYYIPANVVFAGVLLALRRLPLGLVQWVVFVSGLLDIILLSALTVLTGGYQSTLYWLFLALIVRSAVSVPRATSQLALHFTIIICYVMAGVLQVQVAQGLLQQARVFENQRRFDELAASRRLQRHAPALELSVQSEEVLWPPPKMRAPVSPPAGRAGASSPLASHPESAVRASAEMGVMGESPAEPLLVRLTLLLLMSVCAYGVQVLFERQRKAQEEAREFALREGQLHAAGRLAAEFAHQIKNPLAIINNAAFSLQRALKQRRAIPPEQVQIIQEEVERSDQIITEIMGYAQLSEGRVEKLNVIEELDRAIERVFPPAAGYPVQVHRDYGSGFPPLLMLRRHVSEAFLNLLQNAREALDGQGGNVSIRALCHSDYSIEVSIADDGPGIPPDKREQVFEAYYTTKQKGTGLGLATVKHNVELYGGSVRLESELGKGARFTLVFPARTLLKLAQTT